MDVAALWLSAIAIVVSFGAAISQIILWKLSGPNLKVTVSLTTLVGEVSKPAVVVRVTNDERASTPGASLASHWRQRLWVRYA